MGAIDWVSEINSAIGQPDHLVFESWASPQYSDTNLFSVITPINLPENDTSIFSHTRLINEGFTIFDPLPASCCIGSTGNIDGDPADIVDIADLTFLIDYLFINFPPLVCPEEGNVDGDSIGIIDISDLTFLIDHLFINFPPTASCQ